MNGLCIVHVNYHKTPGSSIQGISAVLRLHYTQWHGQDIHFLKQEVL